MAFPKEKSVTLDEIVIGYVAWQNKLDAFEEQRPAIHGRLMEMQQSHEVGEGNEEALDQAKAALKNHDLRIEAAADKLCHLWQECWAVASGDVVAQREAEPKIRAALDQEFEEKCNEAASLLMQGLEITDALGINRAFLVHFLELVEEKILRGITLWGPLPVELSEAINRLREKPSLKAGATYRERDNNLFMFMTKTGDVGLRHHYIEQTISKSILNHGGRSLLRTVGAGEVIHEPKKEQPCKKKF